MKEQKARYVGDLDPRTKLRHGKGTYSYPNKFFQYEGEWENGVKQGHGTFYLKDGTKYEGKFENGEITGQGTKTWPDGSQYTGEFLNGEQHGEGEMKYANGETYVGKWHLNMRQGRGKWTKKNGDVIEGEFKTHYPSGICTIRFANGDHYEGNVGKTGITGNGKYVSESQKYTYDGEFSNGLKQGKGKLVSSLDEYFYEGVFKADKPELLPNKLQFIRPLTEEQKKLEDTKAAEYAKKKKAKKEPKKKPTDKAQAAVDEEQFENRIYWSFEGQPLAFSIQAMFQGEPYPNPAKERKDEADAPKEAKGKDNASKAKKKEAKEEPDMLIPDPVLVTAESNRQLQFKMTKTEIRKNEETGAEEEVEVEYPFIQSTENLNEIILTKNGIVEISDLVYEKTEAFDEGCYVVTVTDLTQSQKALAPIKIAIIIS